MENLTVWRKNVFLIDQPIVCLGLRALIFGMRNNAEVCGTAATAADGFNALMHMTPPPDLVITELAFETGRNGLDMIKNLLAVHGKLRVLVFSGEPEYLYVTRVFRAGAIGFISKNSSLEEIRKEIEKALAGKSVLSVEANEKLLQSMVGRNHTPGVLPVERLSDRELEVFTLIGQGTGTRAIAEMLHLSIKTIESHRAHIKEKLSLENASQLVQAAIMFRK